MSDFQHVSIREAEVVNNVWAVSVTYVGWTRCEMPRAVDGLQA